MPSDDRPILITGAGGFIGSRIAEALALSGTFKVRASLRRWSSAARLGRLPCEIVLADVTERAQVRSAMEGVRAVVHLAKGTRDVTVNGTQNVLECAQDLGVERVVHFSTIEVYGDADGDVDERVAPQRTGRPYGDSKIEAEEVCGRFSHTGVPIVILRPSLVYGPFSENWTVKLAERLLGGGPFPSKRDSEGICNLVYVDDVVAATLLSLGSNKAVGEAFNVNGSERITWYEYLQTFRHAIGVEHDAHGGRLSTRARSMAMEPIRVAAKATFQRFEGPIMTLSKTSPQARRAMKAVASIIQKTPSGGEYRLFNRNAYFPIDKATRILGFRPRFALPAGITLTRHWLAHHGFLGNPEPLQGPAVADTLPGSEV